MSYSFMLPKLPERTFGLVTPLGTMTEMAKSAPERKSLKDQRVELLTMKLSACRLGKESAGILKMSLGLLKKDQLVLIEEAAGAVRDEQRLHASFHNTQSKFSYLVAGGLNSWNERSPYDYIVEAVAGTFQKPALIAIRDFSNAHNNMGELINLCTILDQQGIELTKKNVAVQLVAMHEAKLGRSRIDIFDHPYLTHPELIRAVHDYPTRVHDLMDMFRTRGNVKAAAEVFGSSKAISEGAL